MAGAFVPAWWQTVAVCIAWDISRIRYRQGAYRMNALYLDSAAIAATTGRESCKTPSNRKAIDELKSAKQKAACSGLSCCCYLGWNVKLKASRTGLDVVRVGSRCRGCDSVRRPPSAKAKVEAAPGRHLPEATVATFELRPLLRHDFLSHSYPRIVSYRRNHGELEAFAEKVEKVVEEPQTPNLNVAISVSFPQAEIFGVKLVNGLATEARLSVVNNEPTPISVAVVRGSLSQEIAGEMQVVRNLTAKRYSIQIPAGSNETVPYHFTTELHPQDLRLQLVTILKDSKNSLYTVPVYNETVSIVEAPTSFFDPQIIFLYLVVLGAFTGTVYFIYNTWISTFFPQKKGRGKGGERAKKSSGGSKTVDPADQIAVVGADGPAVTSGAKAYDESWIPASHLQRPEAKRVRSGTPKVKPKA
ncbi:signal sequence receptor alpha chain [Pyrenophora seminiperda CCB06]|uniref:Signal sequence receptor alpha chain n=1 Tax=Pyrenophora seminiperda CCB06 TaxID=1302712 RepID=A0A3M7M9G7_9PLEO|nr:signal sequence receptor alpha chain [Pyrenophora seminiperda CCB06]